MEHTVFKNDIIGITQYYRVIDRNSKTIKLENTRDKTNIFFTKLFLT